MKFQYYPEADSLCIKPRLGPGVETRKIPDGLNVDLDTTADSVVGFDIDHALQRFDLSTLEAEVLSLRSIEAG